MTGILPSYVQGQWWTPDAAAAASATEVRDASTGDVIARVSTEGLDLVGADVHVHASEALYEKLREPRMAPPARLVRMLKAGKLGRKTGEGFYTY